MLISGSGTNRRKCYSIPINFLLSVAIALSFGTNSEDIKKGVRRELSTLALHTYKPACDSDSLVILYSYD